MLMKPTTHKCMAQCKANITRSKKQWHDCQGVEYKSPIQPAMLKYRVPRSVLNLLSPSSCLPACLPLSCSMLGDIQNGVEGCSLAINKISFFLFVVPFPFRNRASLLKLQVHIKGGRVWPPYIKRRSSSAERWCKGVLSLRGFIRRKRGVSHDGCPVAVVDIESISQSVSRPVLTF